MALPANLELQQGRKLSAELPPILIVAYYYPPDIASGAVRPHRQAKYLAKLGHDVRVMCARVGSNGASDEPGVDRIRAEGEGSQRTGVFGFLERCFRKAIFHHDEGAMWVPRVLRHASKVYSRGRAPVVISSAPPLTAHLAGLALKLRRGYPWIADFRDPLVGNPFRWSSATVRTDPFFEKVIFRYADAVIANTETVAEIWMRRYPESKHKIHVQWNGFDPENAPAALPSTGTARMLAHVGVIYGDRDPVPVLSAIDSLIESRQLNPAEIRVALYGPLNPKSERAMPVIESMRHKGWLEIRNEFIPKPEAAKLTASTDYLLLLDVLGEAAGLQVPAKLFEYVCIGRPILASTAPDSPVARILAKSGIPHVCFSEGGEEMQRRLLEFFSLPPKPHVPSEWFQATFNAYSQAEFLSNLAASVAKR